MAITLYDIKESPHGRKVRLLAAELGIPLHLVARDPRTGETRSADYLAKNPNGKIPTLEEDGFILWESSAILKYLAAKHPESGLDGKDAKTKALVDQWLFWWISGPEGSNRHARLRDDHQADGHEPAGQRPRHHGGSLCAA